MLIGKRMNPRRVEPRPVRMQLRADTTSFESEYEWCRIPPHASWYGRNSHFLSLEIYQELGLAPSKLGFRIPEHYGWFAYDPNAPRSQSIQML